MIHYFSLCFYKTAKKCQAVKRREKQNTKQAKQAVLEEKK